MNENQIIFSNYDKIMFIDESGDDGFNFSKEKGKGSSTLYVTSCFITTPEYIDHNIKVLNNAKRELKLEGKELKSTTLKRHRFSANAYEHFKNIKGYAFSFVAFKKSIKNSTRPIVKSFADTSDKELSGILHEFPFTALNHLQLIQNNEKVLIVFDCLKKTEQQYVNNSLEKESKKHNATVDIIYRDSKSEKYQLIQIADVIAGTVRSYIENNLNITIFNKICRDCYYLNNKCNRLPTQKKTLQNLNIENKYKYIFRLHSQEDRPQITSIHVYSLPAYCIDYFSYLTCKILGFNTNKKRS